VAQKQAIPGMVLYAIVAWAVLNILLLASSIFGGDSRDLNNYIEIALWIAAIPALLSLRKWGLGFAIFTFTYTLSTSVGILIYYLASSPAVWPNIIRVIANVPLIIYLFKAVFEGKTK
jgi:hypothetical protein